MKARSGRRPSLSCPTDSLLHNALAYPPPCPPPPPPTCCTMTLELLMNSRHAVRTSCG